jgi:glucose/arabinose dehydrogenase/mono/diheme cytochrome c family protein
MLSARGQLVRQANTTLNLPPDLPSTTGYSTENALGALTFSAPMCTAVAPGETNRLFVAERGGTIQAVSNLSTTPVKTGFLNLTSLLLAGQALNTEGEDGFLSMVFHPDYATNGTLFVYFTIKVGTEYFQRLHQVTVTNPAANTAVIFSHKPLLTIVDRATNHNGGDLQFGADGFLYLSVGDEGGGGDNYNNARFINQQNDASVQRTGFWGKLLRLAVEVDPKTQPGVFPSGSLLPNAHTQSSTAFPTALHGNYRVPADNPFIGYTLWHSIAITAASVRTEIYATGLRNPFRWSFDPPTGRIFIGDVGQDRYEEIDIVNKGDDLGWSWREGLHAFTSGPAPTNPPAAPNPGDPPGTGFKRVDPIYEYDHTNDGVGNDAVVYGPNVTGGRVYRGNRLTELYGAYLFSDYGNGQIVALREQANGTWTATRLATNSGIVDFGVDPRNGDVIFCNLSSNTVRRLLRTGTTGTNPPALLSQTGAFSNLANLTPQPGIVDYEPNVAFWSDYAIKSRWFAIKNLTDTVGFSADGKWTLPTGMVWVKHFDIETTRGNPATRRKLETRFLVKTATDVYGLCYKWRADQTDADLVGEEGLTELIPASSPAQTWRYPSRTECRVCHTAVAGFALSFNTRQINRAHTFGAQTQNQITALSGAGYFTSPPANVNTLPAFAPADDNGRSLEHRVRSYLAVNCVQCHQPGGTATGNWDARPTTPTDAANLIDGVLVNNDGDPANRWVVKGDVGHSMVLKRLQGNGVPRMPPLATNELDPAAIDLLTDWITLDLPTRQSLAEWQTANFGSPAAPNAAPGADPDNDGLRNDFEFLARSSPLNSTERWSLGVQTVGLNYQLTFPQIANRGIVIETGTDLQTWVPWDVPGNAPIFSATTQPRTLVGPMTGPQRFFRARFSEE